MSDPRLRSNGPFDGFKRSRVRARARWMAPLLILLIAYRIWRLAYLEVHEGDALGWIGWVLPLALIAVVVALVFGIRVATARSKLAGAIAARGGATGGASGFLTRGSVQLQGALAAIGHANTPTRGTLAATFSTAGVELWRRGGGEPLVAVPWHFVVGVRASEAHTRGRWTVHHAPAVGVIITAAAPGGGTHEIELPFAVYGPNGLRFADNAYCDEAIGGALPFARLLPSAHVTGPLG